MENTKKPSNKNFGIVFFIVFFIIGLFPLLKGGDLRWWSLIVSSVFLVLGLINSNILTPLNKIWFKFGLLLGKIITPIVLMIIYFFVITPTGIILRLFGKNILNMKIDKNQKSYWINRSSDLNSFKNQF